MKAFIVFFLCFVLALFVAACGNMSGNGLSFHKSTQASYGSASINRTVDIGADAVSTSSVSTENVTESPTDNASQ